MFPFDADGEEARSVSGRAVFVGGNQPVQDQAEKACAVRGSKKPAKMMSAIGALTERPCMAGKPGVFPCGVTNGPASRRIAEAAEQKAEAARIDAAVPVASGYLDGLACLGDFGQAETAEEFFFTPGGGRFFCVTGVEQAGNLGVFKASQGVEGM